MVGGQEDMIVDVALMTEVKRKNVGVGYLSMTDERERLEEGGLNRF